MRRPNPDDDPRTSDGADAGLKLTLDDFVDFFKEVNRESRPGQESDLGPDPFPWQRRLMKQVLDGKWPKVIDLPTGTGKTAVLDIAVFAMAARPDISPRRIVFVIDRRVVVNQVSYRARRIRDMIKSGRTRTLLAVKERLSKMSDDDEPLGVAALQGGIPIDNEWAQHPDQPRVIVSTVDQFGSRLLFNGYGASPSMRPIHAGLAGNDCLVILDEVHLSVPFAQTLDSIANLDGEMPKRRFTVVEMSATPHRGDTEKFTLDVEDMECAEINKRVNAVKKADLVQVKNPESMPAGILKIINSIDKSHDASDIHSVGVVVNFVRTARQVHRTLTDAGYKVHLITGRMRPLDRVASMEAVGSIVDPDRECSPGRLAVVVATQAIEVGADISFDALVTECAAVDSLRQRFGRLDRRGNYFKTTGNSARAWIIGSKDIVKSKKPDPIYGNSTKTTWEELMRRYEDGPVDVGPCSLAEGEFPEGAAAPRLRAPLLLRSHMDAWVQTNPKPDICPTVDWFLHGVDTLRSPDVSIVWRHDRTSHTLRCVPPRQAEYLQIPIYAAKLWLSTREEADVADMDQDAKQEGAVSTSHDSEAECVRWDGIKDGAKKIKVDAIKAGDVLVVDPARGGLTDGTWDPSSTEPVTDLGDEAQLSHGGRVTMRLDPALFNQLCTDCHKSNVEAGLDAQLGQNEDLAQSPYLPRPHDQIESNLTESERIRQWLDFISSYADKPGWISRAVEKLGDDFDIVTTTAEQNSANAYYILAKRHSNTRKPVVDAATMDGSDEAGSMTCTGATLKHHLDHVGERAERIAIRLGLDDFADDLRLAGRLHDIGKADPRFQALLVGDDPVAQVMDREPLAKSRSGVRGVGSSYPRGMRHEVASVAMLKSAKGVLDSANDRDLVLHLIGTHHGWGRPLLPVIHDPDPREFSYVIDGHEIKLNMDISSSSLALDMTDRFWRLVERYGYHGLVWLESILRLADHLQSSVEAKL